MYPLLHITLDAQVLSVLRGSVAGCLVTPCGQHVNSPKESNILMFLVRWLSLNGKAKWYQVFVRITWQTSLCSHGD